MIEAFEKCLILFKFKAGEDFNHRHTLSISRIYSLPNFGGLKSEPNAEIGTFFKGLRMSL